MPGKIKVKILAGRNLPVMDRSGDTTDAYVELKFGTITYKTDVCRKSLNPQWNSEWYRFEVDDAELQDEPLQIRLMDHDTYSANDAIGKVYINLNPLLLPGMLPPVKNIWTLEATMNTGAGSQAPNIPYGYHAQMIHGFVEELVVSDDPEYKWIDKIRTPRASNEARQTLFFKLSGEVQRKIGLKALDLGGNAVIGYLQNFDLEGESGIVARGIGTAVTLVKLHDVLGFPCDNVNIEEIAFALSSCTKARTERLDAEDSASFIPISIPASYPARIPMNRGLSFYASSLSSLTRLERATRIPETPGCTGTRRKARGKRVPFLRCNTLSAMNLRTAISSGSDLASSAELNRNLIDETVRSIRTMLTAEDAAVKREPSRDRLSEQIKHLRGKFDSVGEENHPAVQSDSDADPTRLLAVNSKRERNRNETKTSIMAALLIGSIRNMPLKNVGNDDPTLIFPSDEQSITTNDDEASGACCRENLQENADVKDEEQRQDVDASSTIDEMEMSSFDDDDDDDNDDNSSGDESSNGTASYNILDDSRYSLDGDRAADSSSSLQETIPITVRSSAESCTDSTLQIDSDVAMNCQLSSNLDLASTEDIELRSNAIPVITVDIHEGADSDTSMDAFGRLSNDESSNITISHSLAKSDISVPKAISSSDEREIDDARRKAFERLETEKRYHSDDITFGFDNSLHEMIERSAPQLESPSPAETEEHVSADRERNNSTIIDLPPASDLSRASVSKEELRARAIVAVRRRCMRDLIELIDTRLMVSTTSRATRHGRRAVSLRSKRRKQRERKVHKRVVANTSENSLEKIPSRGTPRRRTTSSRRRRRGENVPLPRVRSSPDYLSSRPIVSILHATSRSCDSSLVNLTDHRGSKRVALLSPTVPAGFDRDSAGIARQLPKSSHGIISAISVNGGDTRKRTTISTICNLEKDSCHIDRTNCKPTNTANMTHNTCVSRPSPDLRQQDEASVSPSYPLPAVSPMTVKMSQSPATRTLANVPLHRRSSDSDLSVTPKGNSLGSSDRSMAGPLRTPAAMVRSMNQDALEMLEYPFITMQHYPPGFILHIGGLVSSRSVKLIERISNLEEPEGRDAWWTEIRMEVRSHARALACNVVIGYKEETSICDDVCVLSASGTAAVINFHNSGQDPDSVVLNKLQQGVSAATVDSDREKGQQKSMSATKATEKVDGDAVTAVTHSERLNGKLHRRFSESNEHEGSCGQSQLRCNLCHLPYSESSVPFRVNVSKCAICKRAKVPDVMFTTIEVPANIPTTGRGCFIQATVCKSKKDLRGELNAKEISDCLPFLEYELHSLLLNKLKIKGMNAIFGLKLQVSVGERFIIGMAVGTAIYLTALPPPTIPQIASGNSWHNEEQLAEMQKSIVETVKKNREFYHLKPIGVNEVENGRVPSTSDTDESDEDLPELDLGLGTRDACVLEVDDIEDMDRISSLMDNRPPDDFHVVNTQTIPGLEDLEIVRNLQMFTQVSRAKIPTGQFASMPSKYFARLLQSLYFKLRRMVPCALCDMQFKVALPEQDEIQLTVVGMALGLGEPLNANKYKRKIVCRSQSKDQVKKSDDSDMIFSLDEDHLENNAISDNITRTCIGNPTILSAAPVQKPRPRSPLRLKSFTTHRRKHVPLKGRYGVDITPLSYLPGGRIERYQGNLNFFFIRESTSIRENGGLSGFTHSFVMEVLAIVRAHITALGGNAMVAFFMTQCVLLHSPHKNQVSKNIILL
ncbi:c2 domain-containing protein 5-like isoform x4 protein [Lasius niger]|uniref:C2 domain-containing protein 5-like isoform x4 protein n=1 Tax=Lasius niger TaxID=67767 RepID=A0A0J7KP23_LASNI|nr:c2 domain-containing protein 5-like isoform x4 protein [Lasius niger]